MVLSDLDPAPSIFSGKMTEAIISEVTLEKEGSDGVT